MDRGYPTKRAKINSNRINNHPEWRRMGVALLLMGTFFSFSLLAQDRTWVTIEDGQFFINGVPTYAGVTWNGCKVEGLLMNARLVQGIFDDMNPETVTRWKYPDTGAWDPERNTREFVDAMQSWRNAGLLSFTINLQGGSPMGYGNKEWFNSAYTREGELRPAYMSRLKMILDRADALGMVPIVGLFYFGQDQHLQDEDAVINATRNAIHFFHSEGYRNLIIEIANECDNSGYDHPILRAERIEELIALVQSIDSAGWHYPVSTSFNGGSIPGSKVVARADFLLLHGNGVHHPAGISEMVNRTRHVPGYRPVPILFNEDDHYHFEEPENNLVAAIHSYASWGYFDFRREGEPYEEGFQSVPVDWTISSPRKIAFFDMVAEITGNKK